MQNIIHQLITLCCIIHTSYSNTVSQREETFPISVNTWKFPEAATKAWEVLQNGRSALDAVEAGCSLCELNPSLCRHSVGFGGRPNEIGETTLDAMIMDGVTHDVGAVGSLRDVKEAISVARKVLEHTSHTLLVGSEATDFALSMGFQKTNLTNEYSISLFDKWKQGNCQPNFRTNVLPDPSSKCGPYTPITAIEPENQKKQTTPDDIDNHDTIGMIAIDSSGNIAAGASTNGLNYKIPGRVGDSPIPGSGAYAEQDVGAAVATGHGDIMMRFMPTIIAVENMKAGMNPSDASVNAVERIAKKYPDFKGAVLAMSSNGAYGAGCYGYTNFPYEVASLETGVKLIEVPCIETLQ